MNEKLSKEENIEKELAEFNDYGDVKLVGHKHNCQQSSNQIKQTQTNSLNASELNTNQSKLNYLPWILGAAGLASLVGIVVYFILKNNRKGGGE